jgi:hypothetical protein
MLLLVFMTDFAKIALATDYVHPSKKPESEPEMKKPGLEAGLFVSVPAQAHLISSIVVSAPW